MKNFLLTVAVIFLLHSTAFADSAYTSLPEIPENGREHYIIYRDASRDNRIELAAFDIEQGEEVLIWNDELSPQNPQGYINDIKYYLANGQWIEFEQGHTCASSNATEVIQSDLNVQEEDGGIRLYGQNEDGSLKDYPNITKNWNDITVSELALGDELMKQNTGLITTPQSIYSGSTPYKDMTIGHFIDIENELFPDEQKCFKVSGGYAIVPTFKTSFTGKSTNLGTATPHISYHPEMYNKVYFTDENYNIKYIAEADLGEYKSDAGYIVAIDGILNLNDEYFAVMKHMSRSMSSDHINYELDNEILRKINGTIIENTPLQNMHYPIAATDKFTVIDHSVNYHESEYMYIGGTRYSLFSQAVERGRDFCYKFKDYYIKPNISNSTEIGSDDPDNHRVGMIRELYFSKDYVNFAKLPLKIAVEASGFYSPTIKRLDDQFCIYYSYCFLDKDTEIYNAQIFPYALVEALVEQEIPENPVYVAYEDKLLSFDTSPRIIDDRTMIPVRFLFETMGAEVSYDEYGRAVIRLDNTEISLMAYSNVAGINGILKQLDSPVIIIHPGRMYVPLRFISEELGFRVEWNEEYRLVNIYNN